MSSYTNAFVDSNGNVIGSATITVYDAGTTNLASIFTDVGLGTPKANPFTSNADGTFQFFAAPGEYKLKMEKTGFTTTEVDYVPVGIGVASSRLINTTAPLTGGGDLSADRTLAITQSGIDHGSIGGLADDDHSNYVHLSIARTITVLHTFDPTITPNPPFIIGSGATGELVTGLNADQLDGSHLAAICLLDGSQDFTGHVKLKDSSPTDALHAASKGYVDGLGGAVDVKRCRVTDSTDQTITTGVATALNWNTETYDTNGFHDNVTNNERLTTTAGNAGRYLIMVGISWAANAGGERLLGIRHQPSGNFVGVSRLKPPDSGVMDQQVHAMVDMAVNDYVEAMVQQSSGGNLDVVMTATHTFFSIEGGQPD
jgi:hypothetical protein